MSVGNGKWTCPHGQHARQIAVAECGCERPSARAATTTSRRPDVCPLCGNCVTCNGERVVEGTNANAGTWSPCPTCTGQQPAQPGSGEVCLCHLKSCRVCRYKTDVEKATELRDYIHWLHNQLTQRQGRICELRIELDAAQQDAGMWEREYRIEHGRVEQLTGELLAAQRRRQ